MGEHKKRELAPKNTDAYGMIAGKAKNIKQTAKRLLGYMGKQKNKLFIMFFLLLISSILTILAPLLIGRVIDQIVSMIKTGVTHNDGSGMMQGPILTSLLLLVALYLVSDGVKYVLDYIKASVAQKLTLSMRIDLNHKLNRLPLRYYDSHKKGEILSSVTNDIEKIVDIFEQSMIPLVTAIVTIIGSVIIMAVISPVLTMITLATIAISMFATSKISKHAYGVFMKNQETMSDLNGHIQELYHGRSIIKAFNKEADVIETVKKLCENQCESSRKAQFITYVVKPIVRFLNHLSYSSVVILGGIFVVQGKLSLGLLQAFIQYMNQSAEPLTDASYTMNMIQGAIASAERIFKVMDEKEEPEEIQDGVKISSPKGTVVFEHVKFGYEDQGVLMQDFNINIKSGDKIAIVGPTGAGKTTIVNLLMRFYELQSGTISIDGVDIRSLKKEDLRKLFGMVLQDTWLLKGTIAENIAFSVEESTFEQVENAAKIARADHFIRTMPKGYETVINEDSTNISQGQIQLLTIARAILADPAILILDEATSNVDTRTEREIQTAMKELMKDRTSFVIAHRLSTIKDSDLIIVLDQGRIVEQGTHEELVLQKGLYEKLYNSQFVQKTAS